MDNAEKMVLTLLGLAFSRPAQTEATHACEHPEIMRVCSQCGKVKEVCCLVDGEPWCEECFEKAMDGGAENA